MLNSAKSLVGRLHVSQKNCARVLNDGCEFCVIKPSVGSTLQAMRENGVNTYIKRISSRLLSKGPVRNVWLFLLNFLDSFQEVIASKL